MRNASIPTADFRVFRHHNEALTYVRERGAPIVVKTSGPASGKGAYPCKTLAAAEKALAEIMLERVHGEAGNEVIVEEFLHGQELSCHALCDGTTSVLLPPLQDHKTLRDDDGGRNTAGMGTIAPVPWVSKELMHEIDNRVIKPVLNTLAESGRPFTGCLYPGLKITDGGLKVLELNARFGDTEAQSYMRLLKTDLLDIFEACVDGKLADLAIEWHTGFNACIVLASKEYPEKVTKSVPIRGIREAERIPGVVVFHAKTKITSGGFWTADGRVLNVTAVGATLRDALGRAYEAVNRIAFEGMLYRRDIGVKTLTTEISL